MNFPSWLPILLGFLTAVGPVSTDMYLPAFPAIEASLGGARGAAQVTLAAWFAGLAVGQITHGSLSDRFGRRTPLLAGMVLYALASAGCALSPSLFWLSCFRFLSALGGSAGMVNPRAVVRDISEGALAVRLMSRLMLVMGVMPVLAPTLGGLVLRFADWHMIFWIAAFYGAVCSALVWRLLPDTLPPQRRIRLGPAALLGRYGAILRERAFATSALQSGFMSFGMFAYLGGSPTVFIGLFHLSPQAYGLLFGANAFFYILASQLNAWVAPRFGLSRTLRASTAGYVVSTAALAAWMFGHGRTHPGALVFVMLPLTCMWLSFGFLNPSATVSALWRHAPHAASASALLGALSYVLGAASGLLIGALDDGTARPMAALLLLGAVGSAVCDRWRPDVAARPDAVSGTPPVAPARS